MKKMSLNDIEAMVMADLIKQLNVGADIMIDMPDRYSWTFRKRMEKFDVSKFEAEHKADATYPIVAAASIYAKVLRDRKVAEIKKVVGDFTLRDLKGASAIRQDADDVLVVEPVKPTKEVPWPRSRVHADKVRSDFGVSGGVATLCFDPGSQVYADQWTDTPAGKDGLLVPRRMGS